jgi:hypothetical protein
MHYQEKTKKGQSYKKKGSAGFSRKKERKGPKGPVMPF